MERPISHYFNGHTVPLVYRPLRDIMEWSPAQVRNWVVGLGAEFHPIAAELYQQQLRGSELLQIGVDRLVSLGISNISHQEIILFALDLMRNISGIDGMSTLVISKSLSLHISDLMQHLWAGQNLSSEPDDTSGTEEPTSQLSIEAFEAVHCVLTDVHNLISVIEQYKQPGIPLDNTLSCIHSWKDKKAQLLAQAEPILSLLHYKETEARESVMSGLKACSDLSETLAVLFNSFHHPPLCNHKATYIVVPLVSIPGSKLGFNLKTYRDGKIRVSDIVPNSPADKSNLLHVGDEVIRVRDQMILAWELSSIICLFSENQSSLSLTIKSRSLDPQYLIPPLPQYTGQDLHTSPVRDRALTSNSITCLPSIRVHSDVNELRKARPLTRRMSLPADYRSKLDTTGDVTSHKKPLRRRNSLKLTVSVSDENDVPMFEDTPTPLPTQAYRTLIVGGVVTRIPINPDQKKTAGKKGKGKLWKSISFRRSQQNMDSLNKPDDKASSSLTESYHVKIINGIPHKFPARAVADAKKKEKDAKKGKKMIAPKTYSNSLPVSQSFESLKTPSLQNGYSNRDSNSKQTASLSSSEVLSPERANSPRLVGRYVQRVASNGEIEVELISEINDAPDMTVFENIPEELKVPCIGIRNPDCKGWLTKLGGSGLTPKNWRKRWFVLTGENIYYYKSSFDFYALGKIYVPKYAIEIDSEIKKKNSFSLYHPLTRTFSLYADTEEDAQKWIISLSKLSRPTFSTPGRISSPSSDSNKEWKSKDSLSLTEIV